MDTLKFKTNINCGGCVAAVTTVLDKLTGVKKWQVDTNKPDKILTIDADSGLKADYVVAALKAKGYSAELL